MIRTTTAYLLWNNNDTEQKLRFTKKMKRKKKKEKRKEKYKVKT